MRQVVTNYEAGARIKARESFRNSTGSFYGVSFGDTYEVYSYHTSIAEFRHGVWWINETGYSITTTQHQYTVRHALKSNYYSGHDDHIHVVHVPRGASSLEFYAGKVAHDRAKRLAQVA